MMSPLTTSEISHLVDKVDPEFTRFNNKTSLRNIGAFSEQAFGNAIAFQDLKKPGSTYFNRVVGFTDQAIPQLPEIVSLYDSAGTNCTLSLPPHRQSNTILSALQDAGFKYVGTDYNFFLRTREVPRYESTTDVEVRRVTVDSLSILFDLFEVQAQYSKMRQFT